MIFPLGLFRPIISPLAIVSVTVIDIDTVNVAFDGEIEFNGMVADATFVVAGIGFQSTSYLGSNVVQLVRPFGQPDINVGDTWELLGPPQWANFPIVYPADGLTV